MTTSEFFAYEPIARNRARKIYGDLSLPPTMAEDDAHDVMLELWQLYKTPWGGVRDKKRRRKLIITCIDRHVKDAAKRRLTNSELMVINGLSVDEAPHGTYDEDGNEENIETALVKDNGHQAELIADHVDGYPEPEYVLLTREKVRQIQTNGRSENNDRRRVCNALMRSLTLSAACTKSGVSDWKFRTILRNFQSDFAQCFRAYRAFCRKTKPTKK